MRHLRLRLIVWATVLAAGVLLLPLWAAGSGAPVEDILHYAEYEYVLDNHDQATIRGYTGDAETLVIPASFHEFPVVGIGERTFERNTRLTAVTIPDSVKSIGHYAFHACTSLTEVTLPAAVNYGWYTFQECTAVDTVHLTGSGAIAGYTRTEAYTNLPWNATRSDVTVTFEDGVTGIGDNVFRRAIYLKEIHLPDSLGYLGANVFNGCTSLTELTLPASLGTVGEGAFSGCTGLASLTIAEGLPMISKQMFSGCTGLSSVVLPDSVREVGEKAFSGCSGLTEVRFPAWANFGANVFQNCVRVQSVTLTGGGIIPDCESQSVYRGLPWSATQEDVTVTLPENLTGIGENVFRDAIHIQRINLPSSVISLGTRAFAGCKGLSSLTLPAHLVEMGEGVYFNCSGLTTLTVSSGVPAIGEAMFSGCTGLTELTLPASVATIGDKAFYGCTGLREVTLPAAVHYGTYSFQNCNQVAEVNLTGGGEMEDCESTSVYSYLPWRSSSAGVKVTLAEGVTKIGNDVFHGAAKLTEIRLPESLTALGSRAFFGCTALESIVLPAALRQLGEAAFSGCKGLKELVIAEGLPEIPGRCFSDCSSLTGLVVPNSVAAIGNYAFSGCFGLLDLRLPAAAQYGSYTFQNCRSVETVALTGGGATQDADNQTVYTFYPWYVTQSDVHVTLESGLTRIGENTFRGATRLAEILLPDTLTSLGDYAFYGCTSLNAIRLPNSLGSIGAGVFYNCTSLADVELPEGLDAIGPSMFYGCSSLAGIRLPTSLTRIQERAFSGCRGLRALALPVGIRAIDDGAFSGCSGMKDLTLPAAVRLGSSVFQNCAALETIRVTGTGAIPDADSANGHRNFPWAAPRSAVAVFLEEGITGIGERVFSGATALDLYLPCSLGNIADTALAGPSDLQLYCPANSFAAVYALDHGISCVLLDRKTTSLSAGAADPERCFFLSTGSSAWGELYLMAGYAFLPEEAYSGAALVFQLPEDAVLVEGSLTLDGVALPYVPEGGVLRVPVEAEYGELRFSLQRDTGTAFAAYGKLMYQLEDGAAKEEVLGAMQLPASALSLYPLGEASASGLRVGGNTVLPGASVDLSVDGTPQATVQADATGRYAAFLTLEDASEGKRYTISAAEAGAAGSAERSITFRENAPVLTSLAMEYGGQRFSLEELMESHSELEFRPGASFRFTLGFDGGSGMQAVYVVSTKDGVRSGLRARWNGSAGAYVAEGSFSEDPFSMPGVLSVEYFPTPSPVSFTDGCNLRTGALVNALPAGWAAAQVQNLSSSAGAAAIQVRAGGCSLRATLSIASLPRDLTPETAAAAGYLRTSDASGRTVFARLPEQSGTYALEVADFDAGETTRLTLSSLTLSNGKAAGSLEAFAADAGCPMEDTGVLEAWEIFLPNGLTEEQKAQAVSDARLLRQLRSFLTVASWAAVADASREKPSLEPGSAFVLAVGTRLSEAAAQRQLDKGLCQRTEGWRQPAVFGLRWTAQLASEDVPEELSIHLAGRTPNSLSVKVTNNTAAEAAVQLMMAAYDGSGKMAAFTLEALALAAGEGVTVPISWQADGIATVRAFLLAPDTLIPLRGAWSRRVF